MQQDFSSVTPNEYLMAAAPLRSMDYWIEALTAPREIAEMLKIEHKQPCLVLKHKTRSMGHVATLATMWHPGDRYQFADGF